MANAKLDLTSIRQASAVIKLAGGAQVTDLTVSEQRAINENLPDGTPSYVVENGEIIVTSNGMSAAARRYNDAVGQLVGQSETDRRKEVNEKAAGKTAPDPVDYSEGGGGDTGDELYDESGEPTGAKPTGGTAPKIAPAAETAPEATESAPEPTEAPGTIKHQNRQDRGA